MNRQEAKKLAPVIQAFADGKTVQAFSTSVLKWGEVQAPSFDPSIQWRVKPEPKEIWVNEYPNGESFMYESKQAAEMGAWVPATRVAVLYREVVGERE